ELESERPTLVCCALGYSRSAAAVAAWMTASETASSIDESITLLRARRPQIALSPAYLTRLEQWRSVRAVGRRSAWTWTPASRPASATPAGCSPAPVMWLVLWLASALSLRVSESNGLR